MTAHFTPRLFGFLRELAANNQRDWFQENKRRYIDDLREPALRFIRDFGEQHLPSISDHLGADARTQGGSLNRIYRDMRFGRDRPPYKTYVSIQFRHKAALGSPGPALNLHLEPRASWAGVGLWHPPAASARQVRGAIAQNPVEWDDAVYNPDIASVWELATHEDLYLKRTPSELKDLLTDHPHPDDLRLRNFGGSRSLTQKEITSEEFAATLADRYRLARPFLHFLATHLDLPL